WYGNRAPLSGMGMIRLGDALIATGRRDEGAALIRKGWTQFTFSPFDENQIMSTQRDYLRAEDQKARLDQLLSRDDIGGANRQLARVDAETKRMAALRMKVKASPSVAAARAAIASSPSARNDPELLFEAARALRRSGQNDEAWALMAQAP